MDLDGEEKSRTALLMPQKLFSFRNFKGVSEFSLNNHQNKGHTHGHFTWVHFERMSDVSRRSHLKWGIWKVSAV